MARARIIKPEFFRSRSLARVSRDARLTFQGLWTEADAKGRGVAHALVLKGSIWPLDEDITSAVIDDHLAQLAVTDHITLYVVGDERYFEVTNWDKHQSAAYRTGDSKHPGPSEGHQIVASGVHLAGQMQSGVPLDPENLAQLVVQTAQPIVQDLTPATPGTTNGVGLPGETSNVLAFAQPVVQLAQPVVHKGNRREGKKTNARACHPDFDAFWAAYPRREARADAERAYVKARGKVDADVLLKAITAQRLAQRETKFVPYPATWLNGERWNDEPAANTTRNPSESVMLPDGTQMSGFYR